MLGFVKKVLYYSRVKVTDYIRLLNLESVDISECRTICLMVGPYRNLSTLTAATLFLHPQCQVLNHAYIRILPNPRLNFISNFSKNRINRFLKFAIKISRDGYRGSLGGSILHAHAFDNKYKLNHFHDLYNSDRIKKRISSFVWKEPLRISNLIRKENIDVGNMIQQDDRLCFLLPIRNPMNCAQSNVNTGLVRLFPHLSQASSKEETLSAIMDEIHWVVTMKKRYVNRFFYFFEHSITRDMLSEVIDFLQLPPDDNWISTALIAMDVKARYKHTNQFINYYKKIVAERFSDHPEIKDQLLQFAQ